MRQAMGIYVGKDGRTNFDVGVAAGTWGWAQRWLEPNQLQPGDLIVLSQGGGGRMTIDEWVPRTAEALVVGRITRPQYESHERLWPDEVPGQRAYPYRVDFELVGRRSRVPFRTLPLSVNRSMQASATKQGRGFISMLTEDEEAQLVAAVEGEHPVAAWHPPDAGRESSLTRAIERVLELQTDYSPQNTTSMEERGRLIRLVIPELLRSHVSPLAVRGGDGSGLKSRVPMVTIFDSALAPRATKGFSLAFLFAADGSRTVLSLNQGTSEWAGNAYVRREDIAERVEWARSVLGPVLDGVTLDVELADSGGFGDGYELGHIGGWVYERGAVPDDTDILSDVARGINALNRLYEAVRIAEAEGTRGSGAAQADPRVAPDDDASFSSFDLAWLAERTLWPLDELVELVETVRVRQSQILLAGPPGTGKTWVAQNLAKFLTGGRDGAVHTVQFHPSYGYEDFVIGLRPTSTEAGSLVFAAVEGPFMLAAEHARRVDHPVVLIVDEMNRANLPRVFGELMYLLEYRDEMIDLIHAPRFSLPGNLVLIGTMNTADRSIRSIDTALRRRFDIFDCPPRPDVVRRFYRAGGRASDVPALAEGMEALNAELARALDRHHTIGHSFFMRDHYTYDELRRTWDRQIFPLIEEYFFDQPDIAVSFTQSRFWPR